MSASHRIAACIFAVVTSGAIAQESYPNHAIRIIVPFPPGGGTDTVTRVIAQKMTENLKQPVVIDNRPGANSIIGAEAAARSAPDGYTLLAAIDSTLAMNPSLYEKLSYDPVKDFAPITLATSYPLILEATPSFPAKDMRELITMLKAQGAKINVAYPALPSQVAGELLKSVLGVQFTGVNYKGGAPALQDVMAGHVPLVIDALGPSLPHVKSGKVKPYAVTSKQRSAALPDVPTFSELGYPGMEVITWVGYLAPAGTRGDIIKKLNEEFVRVLKLPDVRERFAGLGTDIHGTTPEEFAAQIRSDTAKFGKVIKAANIKVE
jgi:tripartite-type tricarboxylate transporter receptor subunit TctC